MCGGQRLTSGVHSPSYCLRYGFSETQSSLTLLGRMNCQAPRICFPSVWIINTQHYTLVLMWVLGIHTPILMDVWQVLCQQSCLPSLRFLFSWYSLVHHKSVVESKTKGWISVFCPLNWKDEWIIFDRNPINHPWKILQIFKNNTFSRCCCII